MIIWVGLTLFFALQLPDLRTDFEFEKFFPQNDPELVFFEQHRTHFGYDNDYLLILLENHSGVFDSTFLSRVSAFSDSIKRLTGTKQVVSPTALEMAVSGPTGPVSFPLLHIEEPARYHSDSIRVFAHPLFRSFFAMKGKSLLVHLTHNHFTNTSASAHYAAQIDHLASFFQLTDARIVGKIVAQNEFIRLIREEFGLFLVGALALSMGLLWFIFRSFKTMLLPYAVSVSCLTWLLGAMALLGLPITILGSLIPPVILFVSASDSIHLIQSFQMQRHGSVGERIGLAVRKVIVPTSLTSMTTAIGFFSLISITTEPIQMLGVVAAVGVLLAFLITFIFGPLLLTNTKLKGQAPTLWPKRWTLTVLRRPRAIFGLTGIFCLIALFGLWQLKADAYLLKDLPESASIRQHFDYTDTHFGGSKPWEMAIWPTDSLQSLWEPEVMAELLKIHDYLQSSYPVERLISPVTWVAYGHQMNAGGQADSFHFPEPNRYEKAVQNARMLAYKAQLPQVISREGQYGRLAGFIPEFGSRETIHRNEQLLRYLENEIDSNILSYQLTGTTYLIDKSHHLLTTNLLRGLMLAIGCVGLVLGLYFRSIKVLVISLIPNLLPLLWAGAFMGYAQIPLQLTTSIIFAVAFGIAVDDTIHFMAAYRQHRAKTRVWRLIKTYRSTGRALVITTLALVAGFSLFLLSDFGATWFLGLFLSIALISALAVDLTLLPLLMHFWSNSKT